MRILSLEEARTADIEFIYSHGNSLAIVTIRKPLQVEDHWNCSICGCSHGNYDDADNCCTNSIKK